MPTIDDAWIKAATELDINAANPYRSLVPPIDLGDPWNRRRLQIIATVYSWETAVYLLREALLAEDEVVPELKKRYQEVEDQLKHQLVLKKLVEEFRASDIQKVNSQISYLEDQLSRDSKIAVWRREKNLAVAHTQVARKRVGEIEELLEGLRNGTDLPELKLKAGRDDVMKRKTRQKKKETAEKRLEGF